MNNNNNNAFYLLFFTLVLFIIFPFGIHAQNSKWRLHIGYEQMYVNGNSTNQVAQKHWIWNDKKRGDLFTMRTTWTHGYNLGISYQLFKWWSLNFHYKKYYRRYYVWPGTYVSENATNATEATFNIIPYVGFLDIPDRFLGRNISSKTWAIGTEFSHKLSKNGKWRMHYSFLLNQDLYEVNLHYFDTPVRYNANGWYNNIETEERKEYTLSGRFSLKAFNPGQSPYSISTNQSIGISRALKNGMALKIDVGFRGIRFLKNKLLDENHWELDLKYTEYNEDRTEVLYQSEIIHKFPLYLGGFYSALTFTFKPFRSKRDNPEWKHWTQRCKEKRAQRRKRKRK